MYSTFYSTCYVSAYRMMFGYVGPLPVRAVLGLRTYEDVRFVRAPRWQSSKKVILSEHHA